MTTPSYPPTPEQLAVLLARGRAARSRAFAAFLRRTRAALCRWFGTPKRPHAGLATRAA